jgi:glucose/arabinose dehydrogenase
MLDRTIRGRRPLATLLLAASMLGAGCGPGPSSAGPTRLPSPVPSRVSSETGATPGATSGPSTSPASHPSFDPTGQKVRADVVVSGLSSPVDVTDAGDGSGRLFVVEQAGIIRTIRDGASLDRPFLDIRSRIASGGERGLLGLAFHPDFPTDPRLFVDYTDLKGNTVIASYRVSASDPDRADPESETVILGIDQPYPNHNGGALAFGPDGMLYIAMGDGGAGGDPQGNGQRLDTYLAKILRLDISGGAAAARPYVVPPDNPFVGDPNAKPEIWLTGLRNPWRIRFDSRTGDLWIGDVGQNAWEEVDVARAGVGGLDFGWNRMEGFHCYQPSSGCDQTGLTLPVTEYGHDSGCAVIGGVVVRDARQGRLDGGYLFGDACSDDLWLIDPAGDARRTPVIVAKLGRTVSSINEAEDGIVYATSLDHGELLRLSAVSPS